MANARLPRYVEIEEALRQQIAEARAGDAIPSESELALRYGVSRMTARQAVRALEADGLVYRVPGSGTFASGNEAHRPMGVLRSFTEDMRERGVSVTSKVLEAGWIDPDPRTQADLALTPTSRAIRVVRVRLGDGVPMALEKVTLPSRCSFLLDCDLAASSLHQLLLDHDIVPTEATGDLVAAGADADDAKNLKVRKGSPLLVERRTIVDQNGRRIERTETRYVGSKYVFDVHLRRPEAS
jgi:GntR family transcriptional regulator